MIPHGAADARPTWSKESNIKFLEGKPLFHRV
jgi:hypothetical protein